MSKSCKQGRCICTYIKRITEQRFQKNLKNQLVMRKKAGGNVAFSYWLEFSANPSKLKHQLQVHLIAQTKKKKKGKIFIQKKKNEVVSPLYPFASFVNCLLARNLFSGRFRSWSDNKIVVHPTSFYILSKRKAQLLLR